MSALACRVESVDTPCGQDSFSIAVLTKTSICNLAKISVTMNRFPLHHVPSGTAHGRYGGNHHDKDNYRISFAKYRHPGIHSKSHYPGNGLFEWL